MKPGQHNFVQSSQPLMSEFFFFVGKDDPAALPDDSLDARHAAVLPGAPKQPRNRASTTPRFSSHCCVCIPRVPPVGSCRSSVNAFMGTFKRSAVIRSLRHSDCFPGTALAVMADGASSSGDKDKKKPQGQIRGGDLGPVLSRSRASATVTFLSWHL